MPADFTLAKQMFDYYVEVIPRFACTWVDHGQQWYVCPSAIMCRNTKAQDSPVKAYKDKPVSEQLQKNKEAVYPENYMASDVYAIDAPFMELFGLEKQVVSLSSGVITDLSAGRNIPMRHYFLQCPTLIKSWNTFNNHRLFFNKSKGLPLVAVDFIGGTLWIAYSHAGKLEEIKIETATEIIVPACWSDKNQCYTKVRKEKKMLEPEKFMNDILKSNLKSSSSDLKFDPEKTGKENDGTAGVTLTEALKTAPKKVKEEPVKEVPVKIEAEKKEPAKEVQEAVKEETAEEPKKATRKKVDTTPVNDLTKVIDNLSGAVPEKLSSETVQTALRQLRDLQLAASRRAANIALQYIKETEGAVTKLAAIKAAL